LISTDKSKFRAGTITPQKMKSTIRLIDLRNTLGDKYHFAVEKFILNID
jgi:hypothetical protein